MSEIKRTVRKTTKIAKSVKKAAGFPEWLQAYLKVQSLNGHRQKEDRAKAQAKLAKIQEEILKTL